MQIDGNKTYMVMAAGIAFGIFVLWNDYSQFGYVKVDAVKYVGVTILGSLGLGTIRSAMKKGE